MQLEHYRISQVLFKLCLVWLMTPCKSIQTRWNLLSSCPWPSWSQFNPEAHWPNYWLTDSMTVFSSLHWLHSVEIVWSWWIHFSLCLCDGDFDDFEWPAVLVISSRHPFLIVLDFLVMKIEIRQSSKWCCCFLDWDSFTDLCDGLSVVMILVI